MNADDFRSLLELAKQQLRDIGEPEIADEDRLAAREREITEPLRQEDLLIEMLSSFGRVLAGQDRRTFEASLKSINESISESEITGAEVLAPIAADPTETTNLGAAPDLGPLRTELRQLIAELRESRHGGRNT